MSKKETTSKPEFALAKQNYMLLLIGFAIIVIGFVLMSGGKPDDPTQFSEDIFSFRRITLAPIVVVFGFIFEIFAIMYKPKSN